MKTAQKIKRDDKAVIEDTHDENSVTTISIIDSKKKFIKNNISIDLLI